MVDATRGGAYLYEEIEDLTEALESKPSPLPAADLEAALTSFKARKASIGKAPFGQS